MDQPRKLPSTMSCEEKREAYLRSAAKRNEKFAAMFKRLQFQEKVQNIMFKHKVSLNYAILVEQFEIAKHLISHGADVRAKNQCGQTALQYAVTKPLCHPYHTDNSKIIVDNIAGYGIDKIDCQLSSCIALTARNIKIMSQVTAQRKGIYYDCAARLSLVKKLLDYGANVNNKDIFDCSPIQCAVYTDDMRLLQTLIDAGANVNNRNSVGATPLHDAVLCSNNDMIHLLISHEACIDAKTLEGNTPLHWAALLNIKNNPVETIKALLDYPIDVNSQNMEGRTPFHYVMCRFADNSDLLERFMEHNADINVKDINGATPLTINQKNLLDRTLPLLPATITNRRTIIEHVARIEAKTEKQVFDNYNLAVIIENSKIKRHYKKCRAELRAMKTCNIKGTSLTYFNVLTVKLKELAGSTSSEELLKLLLDEFQNSDYQATYPIYGPHIRAKLEAYVAKRKFCT